MAILSGQRLTPPRLNTRGVRVRRTTTQSLASGSLTAITWDTEDFDSSTIAGPPTTAVTLSSSGLWGFIAYASFASNGTGYRRLMIDPNALASYPTIDARTAVSGDGTSITFSGTYWGASGDVLRLHAHQNSGGALNLLAGAYFACWLIES